MNNFISQSEVEKKRAERQAEWDRVRKPDDPEAAPEEEIDHRPLFERLREVRDKEQAEKDDEKRLKNSVRGLDSDEAGFLEFVDTLKEREIREREAEENDILNQANQQTISTTATDVSESISAAKVKSRNPSREVDKQSQILSGVVRQARKRKLEQCKTACAEISSLPSAIAKQRGCLPTAVSKLPGIGTYSDSDSESSCSGSTGNVDDCLLNTVHVVNAARDLGKTGR